MTRKEVTVKSGSISGLSEGTGSQKVEASSWSSRSVSVTVSSSSSSRSERMVSLNDRLRGSSGKSVNTSK